MGNLLRRGVKRKILFEKKRKSFYFSHLKKLFMGHLKMVPPQQQQQEEEEQRFPLPDLSASPQIKTKRVCHVCPSQKNISSISQRTMSSRPISISLHKNRRSVQMLKFSLALTLHLLYAVFAVRALALDYAEGGARRGVMAAPWITGAGSVAFCMVKRYILSFGNFFSFFPFHKKIAALWHKDSLIRVLNVPEECSDILRAFDKEFQNTPKVD